MKLNRAILSTGSNMGKRNQSLRQAAMLLSKSGGRVMQYSSVFETAAWGNTDQAAFLNQVLVIETPLPPKMLMRQILQVEMQMGRVRKEKWGPRIIDIDILFYENCVMDYPDLQIPHPQIANRKFVLAPLAEVQPNWKHPVLKKTAEQMLLECADVSEVKKIGGA